MQPLQHPLTRFGHRLHRRFQQRHFAQRLRKGLVVGRLRVGGAQRRRGLGQGLRDGAEALAHAGQLFAKRRTGVAQLPAEGQLFHTLQQHIKSTRFARRHHLRCQAMLRTVGRSMQGAVAQAVELAFQVAVQRAQARRHRHHFAQDAVQVVHDQHRAVQELVQVLRQFTELVRSLHAGAWRQVHHALGQASHGGPQRQQRFHARLQQQEEQKGVHENFQTGRASRQPHFLLPHGFLVRQITADCHGAQHLAHLRLDVAVEAELFGLQ